MSDYSLNFGPVQEDVVSFFGTTFTAPAVVDGLMDDEDLPFTVDEWNNPIGDKVAYILTFHDFVRTPSGRGRSIATTRLDSYYMDFDVITVGSTPSSVREAVNDLNDKIIGHKFLNSGQTVKSTSLWAGSRPVPLRETDTPSRYASHTRFRIPLSATSVNP